MKMEGCLSISRSSSSSCCCFSLSSSSLVSCPIITMSNYYNCYTGPPGGGGGFLLKKNNNGGRGGVATAVSANQVSRGDDGDGQQHDNNNNNKNDKDDAAADDQQPLPLVVDISNGGFSSSTLPPPPPTPIPAASSSYSFSSVDNFNTFEDFKNNTTPNTSTNASGTTRAGAGLFRTPISGGVQSATSVHDLPKPPLAVRNLMEQARFAHLCTVMSRMHHRREGYPFGSLVDFAPDAMGHPIFSFSPLAIHTRNLLADPRCTLVVQIPGWSGLSNARATIFGDVYPLPEDQQEWAHKQYIAKHQQGPSQKWGNFYYFRMQNISDIYFIGGFGTVAWVNVTEYEAIWPDKIAVDGGEQNLKELNAIFSKPLKDLLSLEAEVDDVALISIDSKGTDVRVRQGAQFNIQRLAFEEANGVETLEEAKTALWNLICRGGGELKLEHKL